MRTIGRVGLAFGLVVVLTANVQAQGQGQGRGRGMRMMGGRMAGVGVLMAPQAQEELGLSEDQIEKISEIRENMQASMMEKFQGLQDVPQDERQVKMQAVMSELGSGFETEIKDVLDEKQMARYKEMSLQAMGADAFNQSEVAEKLMLTSEQKEKIGTIMTTSQEETRTAFQDAMESGDREGLGPKMQELRTKAMADVTAVLTDEQKAAWKEMTGKPFTMPAFGGAGGAGGGRRPGRQID